MGYGDLYELLVLKRWLAGSGILYFTTASPEGLQTLAHEESEIIRELERSDRESEASDSESETSDMESEASDRESEASDRESETSDRESEASDSESETSDMEGEASDRESEASDRESEASDMESEASDRGSEASDTRDEYEYDIWIVRDGQNNLMWMHRAIFRGIIMDTHLRARSDRNVMSNIIRMLLQVDDSTLEVHRFFLANGIVSRNPTLMEVVEGERSILTNIYSRES